MTIGVAVAVLLMLFGVLRWRRAVIGALIIAVFEGAFRKWVFPEFGQFIYLMKDFLLFGAYAGYWGPRLMRGRQLVPPHPANVLLGLLTALVALEVLNPELPNLAVGLFGVKAYLAYVPLLYLMPVLFAQAAALERFWKRYLVLALIPLALGPVQFASPADSVLNRYAWEDEDAPRPATFGVVDVVVRITGTFSYLTGYTTYLTLLVLATLALLMAGRQGVWARRSLYALLGLILANMLMTGARGVFLQAGGAFVAMLGLGLTSGSTGRRRIMSLLTGLSVVTALTAGISSGAFEAFTARAGGAGDFGERLVGLVTNPVWAFGEAGLGGYGVGSTHQATLFLVPGVWSGPPPAEGEWERMILEIGPAGFALVLLSRVLVTWQLGRAWRAARGTGHAPYVAAALGFSLVYFPGSLVFNHTAALFYWFSAGMGLVPAVRRREGTGQSRTVGTGGFRDARAVHAVEGR